MAKVKQKTKKSAAKRFSRTGTGKIKRGTSGHSHLLGHKSRKTKRKLRGTRLVSEADAGRLSHVLPK